MNFPEVILGLVATTDKIMAITLKVTKIMVGYTKNAFLGLSNFGIKLDNAIERIMAFTESRILALVSAMSLNVMWFFKVTLNNVSTLRSERLFESVFCFVFLVCFFNCLTAASPSL